MRTNWKLRRAGRSVYLRKLLIDSQSQDTYSGEQHGTVIACGCGAAEADMILQEFQPVSPKGCGTVSSTHITPPENASMMIAYRRYLRANISSLYFCEVWHGDAGVRPLRSGFLYLCRKSSGSEIMSIIQWKCRVAYTEDGGPRRWNARRQRPRR